jgi:hypothetical protein
MFILRLYTSGILRGVLWQLVTGFSGKTNCTWSFLSSGPICRVGWWSLTDISVPSSWTVWYLKVRPVGCAELSVSGCQTALRKLSVSGCQSTLRKLSVSGCQSTLRKLSVSGCQSTLRKLSVSGCQLRKLSVSGYQSTMRKLSVSNCQSTLRKLSVSGCQSTLLNIPNERKPQVQSGVNRKSRIAWQFLLLVFFLQRKSLCTQYHYMVHCKKTRCVFHTYNILTP